MGGATKTLVGIRNQNKLAGGLIIHEIFGLSDWAHADVKIEPKAPVEDNSVESWLTQFRSGQKREPWLADAVKPLETMLNSDSESEQVPAALMLVALGVDEPALSRLIKLAGTQPHQIPTIAKALGWLPWNQRTAFFDQLRQLTRGPDQIAAICQQLVVIHDVCASQSGGACWRVIN